jgi:hypothetical protein
LDELDENDEQRFLEATDDVHVKVTGQTVEVGEMIDLTSAELLGYLSDEPRQLASSSRRE